MEQFPKLAGNARKEEATSLNVEDILEALKTFGKPIRLEDLIGYFVCQKQLPYGQIKLKVLAVVKEGLFQEKIFKEKNLLFFKKPKPPQPRPRSMPIPGPVVGTDIFEISSDEEDCCAECMQKELEERQAEEAARRISAETKRPPSCSRSKRQKH